MANAKRDQNHVPVALGLNYQTMLPSELVIDPITGYVLIEIQPWPDYTEIPPIGNARRDQNHVHAGLALVNDGLGTTLQNLPMNKQTGLLQIDYISI